MGRLYPRRFFLVAFILLLEIGRISGQSIGPSGTVGSGGQGSGAALSWSVGQISGASFTNGSVHITSGIQQPDIVWLALTLKVYLSGPFDPGSALMNDGLRSSGLIPAMEPYSALGIAHAGQGGGEQVFPSALIASGSDAIVDWIMIELRDPLDPQKVLSSRSALLQRDGDVVEPDGSSPLRISAVPGLYFVAVRHRNHLPVITASPIALGLAAAAIDLTVGTIPVAGIDAMRIEGGVRMLWAGDVNGDHLVKYVNTANDRDPILVHVGGTIPTNVVAGYTSTDVNLDGLTKYAGAGNDRDPILFTVGGTIPTAVRSAQFP